jgi:hypothetical protein
MQESNGQRLWPHRADACDRAIPDKIEMWMKHVLALSADRMKVTGKWFNNRGDLGATTYVKQK